MESVGRQSEGRVAREVQATRKVPPEPAGILKAPVPVTRVGQALGPEDIASGAPPPVFETERGGNCVIVVAVNSERFRLTCDSGASRDVIRTSFAEKLRTDKRTKSATFGPRPMSQSVSFVGVIKNMTSAEVNQVTQIRFRVWDSEDSKNVPIVRFVSRSWPTAQMR